MKKHAWWIELFLIAVIAFAGSRLLMTQVLAKDSIQGDSMRPTLQDKDGVFSVRHKHISRNDIVVIDAPDRPNKLYVKRVIGLPGDSVKVVNEQLYINGEKQAQPYLKTSFMRNEIKEWGEITGKDTTGMQFTSDFDIATDKATRSQTVPAGEYFVMGDNRFVSHDGRAFGFVTAAQVESVVVWRYWPLDQMRTFP